MSGIRHAAQGAVFRRQMFPREAVLRHDLRGSFKGFHRIRMQPLLLIGDSKMVPDGSIVLRSQVRAETQVGDPGIKLSGSLEAVT